MSQQALVENRIGLVMYGGISLAIYMNGVAEEFLNLVLSTAGTDDKEYLLPADRDDPKNQREKGDALTGTRKVYRMLAEALAKETNVMQKFVVDILSGTSAGGLNAIFLAKAISEKKSFAPLRDFWINEGDIDVLLDDNKSYVGLPGLIRRAPRSLLNSRKVYLKLVEALDEMDRHPLIKSVPDSKYSLVEELDVHMTATDLTGRLVPVYFGSRDFKPRSLGGFGPGGELKYQLELEHKAVFHFRHCEADDARDFSTPNNPFLAFVGRCTSAIVPAFEPMRLIDAKEALSNTGQGPRYLPEAWKEFFSDYWKGIGFMELKDSANNPKEARKYFEMRPFGDGGYLDKKPFGWALQSLKHRRADTAVRRVVFYLEPHPLQNDAIRATGGVSAEPPNAIEHGRAALSLSSAQNIGERVREMRQLGDQAERVRRSLAASKVSDEAKAEESAPWRLYLESTLDQLSEILADLLGFGSDKVLVPGLRHLLHGALTIRYMPELASTSSDGQKESAGLIDDRDKSRDAIEELDMGYLWRMAEFLRRHLETDILKSARSRATDAESQSRTPQDALTLIKHLNNSLFGSGPIDPASFEPESSMAKKVNAAPSQSRYLSLASPRRAFGKIAEALAGLREDPTLDLAKKMEALAMSDDEKSITENLTKLDIKLEEVCYIQVRDSGFGSLAAKKPPLSRALEILNVGGRQQIIKDILSATVNHLNLKAKSSEIRSWAEKQGLQGQLEAFKREDAITFPIMYQAGLSDSYVLDLVRISPTDATSIVGDASDPCKKLSGTSMGHFGAFFTRQGRIMDIIWGRLDAAEIILRTYMPTGYEALLESAQAAILAEALDNESDESARKLISEVAKAAFSKQEVR